MTKLNMSNHHKRTTKGGSESINKKKYQEPEREIRIHEWIEGSNCSHGTLEFQTLHSVVPATTVGGAHSHSWQ